jgi:L-ascorbate metabolism protein UlaG (beta-lactamase superfamily)
MEIDNLFWVNHACFYIKTKEATIFIDPFKISDSLKEKADLILISHAHFDHFNQNDIMKVMKKDTKFILANECKLEIEADALATATPGFKTNFNGISIEAVRSYNTNPARLQNHPKAKDWVGYILDVDGTRIYHAGDTDFIPEMKNLNDIDIALLPMGGTYTMGLDEAIEAAKAINPEIVIPMHYKMLLGREGSADMEENVKTKLSNAHIMKEVQDPIYSFQ